MDSKEPLFLSIWMLNCAHSLSLYKYTKGAMVWVIRAASEFFQVHKNKASFNIGLN